VCLADTVVTAFVVGIVVASFVFLQ